MRLNYFFKFILLSQVVFYINVYAEPCANISYVFPREGEGTKIAITEKVHINQVLYPNSNSIVVDPFDIEFWVEQCVNDYGIEYSLFATVTPTVSGKSNGAPYFDIAIIQNNIQFGGALYFTNNLFISGDYWTALRTIYPSNGSIISVPAGMDLSQPFTLIYSCKNSIFINDACTAVNDDKFFQVNPQPTGASPTVSSVTGIWYDSNYSGSGFNMVQTTTGLIIFYYGYKANADGETLWLLSSTGPKTINKGETFTLEMLSGFLGNGGSLTTKPNTVNSGTRKWGTAEVTFNTCNSGVIKLTNNNGVTVTHNINRLTGVDDVTCNE